MPKLTRGINRLALLAVVALTISISGCPSSCETKPGEPGIFDCASQAVQDHAISILPNVNDCLTGGSVTMCLISLISPVAGITQDVLSCVVRSAGSRFAMNADDDFERQASSNATAFLCERGAQFKDGDNPDCDGDVPPAVGAGMGGDPPQ